jgi:peptidoglycan/LPS O-acetylase OafA/YrhL
MRWRRRWLPSRNPMTPISPLPPAGHSTPSAQWVVELQSFRGLAALTVLLHHCSFYYDYHAPLRNALEIIINAHAAVVAFFVLSGFVLGMSVLREGFSWQKTLNYLIRRAFRIYPALWVGCGLAIVYMLGMYPPPADPLVSEWWRNNLPTEQIGIIGAIKALSGFGRALPLPIWTITIELAGSVLIPVFLLALRFSHRLFIALIFALAALSYFSDRLILQYLFHFAIGFSITLWAHRLKQLLVSRAWVAVWASVAFFMLVFGRQLGGWSFSLDYHAFWPNVIEGIAAAALIAIIYSRPEQFSLLRARFPRFLGDISYSVYILHLPIMAFVAVLISKTLHLAQIQSGGILAMMMLTLLTTGAAIAVGAISYRYVELPGIRLGRIVIARMPQISRR